MPAWTPGLFFDIVIFVDLVEIERLVQANKGGHSWLHVEATTTRSGTAKKTSSQHSRVKTGENFELRFSQEI
jgi:hypothetical protein